MEKLCETVCGTLWSARGAMWMRLEGVTGRVLGVEHRCVIDARQVSCVSKLCGLAVVTKDMAPLPLSSATFVATAMAPLPLAI